MNTLKKTVPLLLSTLRNYSVWTCCNTNIEKESEGNNGSYEVIGNKYEVKFWYSSSIIKISDFLFIFPNSLS